MACFKSLSVHGLAATTVMTPFHNLSIIVYIHTSFHINLIPGVYIILIILILAFLLNSFSWTNDKSEDWSAWIEEVGSSIPDEIWTLVNPDEVVHEEFLARPTKQQIQKIKL